MCGRYTLAKPDEKKVQKRFKIKKIPKEVKPRYNVSPSQNVAAILNESPDKISFLRWGLIPHWSKDEKIGYRMINARAETILEKPSFKGPFRKRRCLVLADSFYEWKKVAGGKRPYRIMMEDESLFAFAGIWSCWEGGDEAITSCSIITTTPNKLIESIHDRMPVIIPAEHDKDWLGEIDDKEALKMLKPFPASKMKAYEISTLVNSPKNDVPEVLQPAN